MDRKIAILILALFLGLAVRVQSLSVLSHEEVIDIMWDSDIRPAILRRFPAATPEQMKRAHAFAYGGSVVQDVGYYPLGNRTFTNFLHYVRTGDFVAWMIRDARDIDEFAFALGALSHYAVDSWGHASVNLAVPIEYPGLRAKYGDWVTYEEDQDAHLRTEFSFDVLEVAKRRYNSKQYHDFIGFQVSEDLLERAFQDTYGVPMDQLLHYDDLTLETFRFSVAKIVPEMTQVALATHKPKIAGETRDAARQEFLFHISRADYEKEFGSKYRRPGIIARILGFLIKLMPFGPAKVLGYRNPTPQTEDYYFRSMNKALAEYRQLITQVNAGDLQFANRNLDTGRLTQAGEYQLGDKTYVALVSHISHDHFRHITPALKANILAYFSGGIPQNGSVNPKDWKKVEFALVELKELSPTVFPKPAGSKSRSKD
ncbi:MAG TPA: zinc dependent phospholipase C family protein [Terriglobales bacterium]|nr:zinc dependent phospholipase C family protein [Terriglobales bacterium]